MTPGVSHYSTCDGLNALMNKLLARQFGLDLPVVSKYTNRGHRARIHVPPCGTRHDLVNANPDLESTVKLWGMIDHKLVLAGWEAILPYIRYN